MDVCREEGRSLEGDGGPGTGDRRMDLQKINVKIFTRGAAKPSLADFIPVFHSWIQRTDGEYHDVADYSHVDAGPGVLLIAHEANLSMDEQGRRRGLLFNQKQALSGSNRDKLKFVLQQALQKCQQLEREPSLVGKVEFRGDEVVICVNDRLLAPNTEETLEELRDDLDTIGTLLFGSKPFALRRDDDPGRRFAVHLESRVDSPVSLLVANLIGGD